MLKESGDAGGVTFELDQKKKKKRGKFETQGILTSIIEYSNNTGH